MFAIISVSLLVLPPVVSFLNDLTFMLQHLREKMLMWGTHQPFFFFKKKGVNDGFQPLMMSYVEILVPCYHSTNNEATCPTSVFGPWAAHLHLKLQTLVNSRFEQNKDTAGFSIWHYSFGFIPLPERLPLCGTFKNLFIARTSRVVRAVKKADRRGFIWSHVANCCIFFLAVVKWVQYCMSFSSCSAKTGKDMFLLYGLPVCH